MKTIQLTQGFVALIDDADYDRVSAYKWHAKRDRKNGMYAATTLPRVKGQPRKKLWMHRFIKGVTDPSVKVDHEDHNGLNNRRENLRKCVSGENNGNQRKLRGSSQFKGVSWNKNAGKWEAGIGIDGRRLYLGQFSDEVQAARAYDEAARAAFGEFAHCNFPLKIACVNASPASMIDGKAHPA